MKATASYERFRRVRVVVTGPAAVVGREVEAREGERVLGSATFRAARNGAQAEVTLPMPAVGKAYGELTLVTGAGRRWS